jgi:2'-5' RNA ligase
MPHVTTKRLFIAILLPETVRTALTSLQQELKKTGADVKWVEPCNMHITLKFLGDVSSDKIPIVQGALKNALAAEKAFPVTLDEIGAFPSKSAPRILWTGAHRETPPAADIAAKIDAALSPLGFQKESRPFTPHATLGRVRSSQNRVALIERINQISLRIEGQIFSTDSIALMESRLTSAGPTYTPMEKFSLI